MASSLSSRCFSFCSAISRDKRRRHGVERLFQRGHLVAGPHLYAVGKIALVHVLVAVYSSATDFVMLRVKSYADIQRHQFDESQKNGNGGQRLDEDARLRAQRAE